MTPSLYREPFAPGPSTGGSSQWTALVSQELISSEQLRSWTLIPAHQQPELITLSEDQTTHAAVLVSHRPHSAYLKIVDVAGSPEAIRLIIESLKGQVLSPVDGSTGNSPAVVTLKWQDRTGEHHDLAVACGFHELPAPQPSGPGANGEIARGYWYAANTLPVGPRYFRQTTDYTCGPVTALLAEAHLGIRAGVDQGAELELWRQATYQPGCDPLGLASRIGPGVAVSLHLDTEELLFTESDDSPMRLELRRLLLEADRRRHTELGRLEHRERISIEQIAAALDAGSVALLLIDEQLFHQERGAHWLFAYAHTGSVIWVHDPWATAEVGESWVETSALPVSLDDLDEMVAWGPEQVRGVILLGHE